MCSFLLKTEYSFDGKEWIPKETCELVGEKKGLGKKKRIVNLEEIFCEGPTLIARKKRRLAEVNGNAFPARNLEENKIGSEKGKSDPLIPGTWLRTLTRESSSPRRNDNTQFLRNKGTMATGSDMSADQNAESSPALFAKGEATGTRLHTPSFSGDREMVKLVKGKKGPKGN